MELLTKLLYWISTGLLLPVVVGLLLYLLHAFVQAGGAYATYVERLRFHRMLAPLLDRPDGARDLLDTTLPPARLRLAVALRRLQAEPADTLRGEKLLADFELDCQRELRSARVLVRMGPTLGLMGTLIPMGPALVGLARGDVATMAENLQIAFATTVIGLLVGGIGFLVLQAKQHWFAEDANTLHFLQQTRSARRHEEVAL